MAISEFQTSLIALGAAAVAGVFAFNKWQEWRHEKNTQKMFGAEHKDVLIDSARSSRSPQESGASDAVVASTEQPGTNAAAASAEPLDPALLEADPAVECVLSIDADEPIPGPVFWDAQKELFAGLSKSIRWIGAGAEGQPVALGPNTGRAFHHLLGVLPLADRRGPLTTGDLDVVAKGMQRMGDRFLAVAPLPQADDVLARAHSLDAFCAGVDVQIGVNVVAAGQPFTWDILAPLTVEQGLKVEPDGLFHARDSGGRTLYTLGNLEPDLFVPGDMVGWKSGGVTLMLDVPRVPNGDQVFDRMMGMARRLADAVGGAVVDDNRVPLAEGSLELIRAKIQQFQRHMAEQGIPAGSGPALRLFS